MDLPAGTKQNLHKKMAPSGAFLIGTNVA